MTNDESAASLSRYAWLSVAAAVVTILLKTVAYFVTGSVGLLSDAAESVVNLVAAVVAVVALRQAAKPADAKYSFGRSKAEYFSSTVEGAMIFIAAGFIVVSAAASAINGVVAVVLMRAGRRHGSPALVSDARHLWTDVATSAGVVVGVGLVAVTHQNVLDPVVALLVGLNILVTGWRLLHGSLEGLMDVTLSEEQNAALIAALEAHSCAQVRFHGLQTRAAGQASFANVHMLIPGSWSVRHGHEFAHEIAEAMEAAVPGLQADVHLEPLEDPRSYEDIPAGSLSVGDGDTYAT